MCVGGGGVCMYGDVLLQELQCIHLALLLHNDNVLIIYSAVNSMHINKNKIGFKISLVLKYRIVSLVK